MDIFINDLDSEKFRKTNNIWNQLGLNSPDNVGMVSDLINQQPFSCKEEWEEYYYIHGRTKEYLANVGKTLYEQFGKAYDISLDECIKCVRFRVICETWNGIIIRETNTIKTIDAVINDITESFNFKKTIGVIDFEYGVDYEMFHNDKLICGIQIKPTSYNVSDADYTIRAKRSNGEKNWNYRIKFGVPVITITSDLNGSITSHKELIELLHFLDEIN